MRAAPRASVVGAMRSPSREDVLYPALVPQRTGRLALDPLPALFFHRQHGAFGRMRYAKHVKHDRVGAGGYAGGQAQFARVPFIDVGALKIPDGLDDEKVLFLSDIFPTGYMAAENCQIKSGDVVAIWGCGPVGQFAIRSAFLLGAERVIAIDRVHERLKMARTAGAEFARAAAAASS